MKLKVEQWGECKWYIHIENEDSSDREIAKYLNMGYIEYLSVIQLYNTFSEDGECWFYNEEDANNFLNSHQLEPYLIMANLTE